MKITKGDKIMVGSVIIINLLCIPFIFALQKKGTDIIVEVNNKLAGNYSIENEQLIQAKGNLGITEIEIKNKKVRIIQSPCSQKLCVKMGWIGNARKIAACIPNKVVVRVVSNNYKGLDAIVE